MSVSHRYMKGNPNTHWDWELSKEDSDRLCAIGSADARIDGMRVKCPGSDMDSVKKECWLEVDVTVYPASMECPQSEKGSILHGKEDAMRRRVQELWDGTATGR